MRPLLFTLLLVGCKQPLVLETSYRVEEKGVRVDLRTTKGAEIRALGETRTAQSDHEVFLVRFDQLSEGVGGRDKMAHFEAHRGGEVKMSNVIIPNSKLPGGATSGPRSSEVRSGAHGVTLLSGSTDGDVATKVASPFGDLPKLGGNPPILEFSIAPNTTLEIAGAPVKGPYQVDYEKLVVFGPTSDLFGTYPRKARITVPVKVTAGGETHTEKLTFERDNFDREVDRLFEPLKSGKPIDLGPNPTGGVIFWKPTIGNSLYRKTLGPMASLRDAKVAIWGRELPAKPAGTCGYFGSKGKVTVPAMWVDYELSAYDIRKGKLLTRKVMRDKERCPKSWSTFGGKAGTIHNSPSDDQLNTFIKPFLK